ncbi:helix-turn-helix transcriptional regulator [Thalassobacillus sp. CUG 92003]|uniref:helix-turn-helix domain-containing protein n=1 Tax=Thalassobacillus sp. CUG 92003 TaxID=2736641 RepID=UPI0015E780E1
MAVKFGRCRLREILAANNMRQYQLAENSSKSQSEISDYISSRKHLSYLTAVEFAQIIGCHAEDFYDWEWE